MKESQLLYGDRVEILGKMAGWVRVRVPDQMEWTHHARWEGYPGWIQSSDLCPEEGWWSPNLLVTSKLAYVRKSPDANAPIRMTLSLGTRLMGEPGEGPAKGYWKLKLLDGSVGWVSNEEVTHRFQWPQENRPALRDEIVRTALLFMGDPYHWGGRSAYNPHAPSSVQTGTDCSGLVGLVYQAHNIIIPRDAHEQWLKARPIARKDLQPADLIFIADFKRPERIAHVMLYIGQGRVIEAPGTGKRVRVIALRKRLKEAQGRRIAFGTYLP
jgi:hypothetical protein